MTYVKRRKGCRKSCDASEATKSWRMRPASISNPSSPHLNHSGLPHSPTLRPFIYITAACLFLQPFVPAPTSQLVLQPFRRFTYVTTHSETLPLLYLRHRHFTYVTWRAVHSTIRNETIPFKTVYIYIYDTN